MKKLVILFFGIMSCFNLLAEKVTLRNGARVQKEVVKQKWQALKTFADQNPDQYRWMLMCLAQQCNEAKKQNKPCSIRLYGTWELFENQEEYKNKLKELAILSKDDTLDKNTCNIIASAFSGTLYTAYKGGGIRLPIYFFPWQRLPKMVNPIAVPFLSKLPGYDRNNREYVPSNGRAPHYYHKKGCR